MMLVREPAVAGLFYPDAPHRLTADLDAMLAANPAPDGVGTPKMLLVPHAGYLYSGPVAATAYNLLHPRMGITRVVLLGPVHHVPVAGLAVPGADRFRTPLGDIPLDREAIATALAHPAVVQDNLPHQPEHALEVQLPFLQARLGNFSLLPMAVGNASPEQVAEVLEMAWGGEETLIVISSDLSHYLDTDAARLADGHTARAILQLDHTIDHHHACGATPLDGALICARRHGLRAVQLDLRNSADTAGDPSRVVGYAAFAFVSGADGESTGNRGAVLTTLARNAIAERLGLASAPVSSEPWLQAPGASFVTLHTDDNALRGCIGSLHADRPLEADVRANAVAAAFRDPRFPPVTADELERITVEVSVLSEPEPIVFATEQQAREALRPGVDGVILSHGSHRGTFLPQVWDSYPEPSDFLDALKVKSGLPPDFWSPDITLQRYTVNIYREGE